MARTGRLPTGGWYSNDLLDNLGQPSATTIVPGLQHLEVGQWVPMSPKPPPTERTALRVDSFEIDRWLLWTKPDEHLGVATDADRRQRDSSGHPDPRRLRLAAPADRVARRVLMEFGDFAMLRRMLRGIKMRAESAAAQTELSDAEVLA